ncbi:hypothetical protein RhiLY_14456 [Ceratobasidium sp. AG-Ba]|nr:hypothetical protein RhiLY_14456 [Ceratobasidium sp. AG-Ba]
MPVLVASMPAVDPSDQQAARSIEKSLRDARIRRSAELIEAAQTDSRVLLEHVRAEWSKTRRSKLDREERLNKA